MSVSVLQKLRLIASIILHQQRLLSTPQSNYKNNSFTQGEVVPLFQVQI